MNLIQFIKQLEPIKKQVDFGTRPRMVLRPRTRTKINQQLLIGSALLLLNITFVFIYFYFGKTNSTNAAQVWTTGSNGNWNASASWSTGRAPSSDDTLTIMAGNTIVINNSTTVYANMKIIVYGTLHINNGKK